VAAIKRICQWQQLRFITTLIAFSSSCTRALETILAGLWHTLQNQLEAKIVSLSALRAEDCNQTYTVQQQNTGCGSRSEWLSQSPPTVTIDFVMFKFLFTDTCRGLPFTNRGCVPLNKQPWCYRYLVTAASCLHLPQLGQSFRWALLFVTPSVHLHGATQSITPTLEKQYQGMQGICKISRTKKYS
jgi:hypothetical protein